MLSAVLVGRLPAVLFVQELYLHLFLLVISGVALWGASRDTRGGWVLLTLVFVAFLFNIAYLRLLGLASGYFAYPVLLLSALGFVVSVRLTHSRRRRHVPRVVIEDMPETAPAGAPEKRKPRGRPKKKPARRKAA